MLRERAKLFTAVQFVADVLLSAAAFPLAYYARLNLNQITPERFDRLMNPVVNPLASYAPVVGVALPIWAMAAFSLGLYRLSMRRSDREKLRIVVESSILLGLFLGFLSFALKLEISRPLIFLFLFFQTILLAAPRIAIALRSSGRRPSPDNARQIVIVGTGPKARDMGALISMYSEWGLHVAGYVAAERGDPTEPETAPDVLGTVAELHEIVERNVVDEIILVGSEPKDL